MKLRTRLIISFGAVILIPLLLFGTMITVFSRIQIRAIEQTYGISFPNGLFSGSAMILSRTVEESVRGIEKTAQEDPDSLLSYQTLQEIDEELEKKHSFLLVRSGSNGSEVYYCSRADDAEQIADQLPPFGDEAAAGSTGVFIGEEKQLLVRQVDVTFTDGSRASVFVLSPSGILLPEMRALLVEAFAFIILILIITAVFLSIWIYTGINAPIGKLRDATRRIADGDLDFSLEAEGESEISYLFRDFEAMRKKLKESEETKERYDRENRELISNISHDLKTPITTVKGYVEGIMDGVADTPEKMDRYIKTIYSKACDMERLVNELTFYSKIDTNRIPYTFHKINVAEYFEDCAEEVGMEMEEKGIRFSYSNTVDPSVVVIADAEQMKRVINNIIGNSVKYMDKPDKHIQLRIRDAGDFIQVEIEDNGKGIAVKDLPSIFDRFYRTDASRSSAQGGSGIGLSIVRKIVEDHGGRIWASSTLGRGTTMTFVLRKYQEVPA